MSLHSPYYTTANTDNDQWDYSAYKKANIKS